MPSKDATLEEIRAFFANDRFATQACHARIMQAAEGFAVCECEVVQVHLNAMDAVMGGAIFTLADFALAVASNIGDCASVSVSNSIQFLNAAKGPLLRATCTADKVGSTLAFYTVKVEDGSGRPIALMNATCHRRPHVIP